jgi:surface antigen
LRCAGRGARARVSVARRSSNRHARGPLFRSGLRITPVLDAVAPPPAATVPIDSSPFPRPILPASAEALDFWQSYVDSVVSSFRNGQCTDWAQRRRPDIVQNGYLRRFDLYGTDGVLTSWDAKHWSQNATEAGMAVTHKPVVGAVMVFQPGALGAGSAGHVAVVESVAANGSFQVTQMHAPNIGEVSRQTHSAAAAGDPGISFIP